MTDSIKPHYFIKDGAFVFNAISREISIGKEVALMFSWNALRAEFSTLYKHGKPKDVRKAYNMLLNGIGNAKIADHARMITLTLNFPLEELNRFLSISGYIGIFLAHAKALGGIEGENFFKELKEKAESAT